MWSPCLARSEWRNRPPSEAISPTRRIGMRKTVLGIAGIAVALTMIGGATFAAWSDFAEVKGNESGAGVLTLDVSAADGAPTFTLDDMVPGKLKEETMFLVNRDDDAVPLANLRLSFSNVNENENGCSSNSEAAAENGTTSAALDADCALALDLGEFGSQAQGQILKTAPGAAKTAADCSLGTGGPAFGSVSPGTSGKTFAQILAGDYDMGSLAPGQGICVRMNVSLPIGATDASQGDSVSYDLRFDLSQVLPIGRAHV